MRCMFVHPRRLPLLRRPQFLLRRFPIAGGVVRPAPGFVVLLRECDEFFRERFGAPVAFESGANLCVAR